MLLAIGFIIVVFLIGFFGSRSIELWKPPNNSA